jgi:hypothetical protein
MVGVELAPDRARVVALALARRAPGEFFDTDWDPEQPDDLVARLAQQLGPTRRIALSVGFGFLHIKQVKLPPVPASERRRMLALEPDRFFPVQEQSLAVALANESNLAFAADAGLIEQWIAAFERWAPVENVEAAPQSVARALGKNTRGSFVMPIGTQELGLVELEHGVIQSARRMPWEAAPGEAAPLPAGRSGSGHQLAALGAAQGSQGALEAMLLSDGQARRIQRRRVVRLALTAVACSVALGLAVAAVDHSRARTLERTRSEIGQLTPLAQEAMQLRDRLGDIEREAQALGAQGAGRPQPLPVLAALSQQLPAGTIVTNVKANGADWQIDGTATDAAVLVPLLDRDVRFEDVRFLSASARFRDGARTAETFSIAFRVRTQP